MIRLQHEVPPESTECCLLQGFSKPGASASSLRGSRAYPGFPKQKSVERLGGHMDTARQDSNPSSACLAPLQATVIGTLETTAPVCVISCSASGTHDGRSAVWRSVPASIYLTHTQTQRRCAGELYAPSVLKRRIHPEDRFRNQAQSASPCWHLAPWELLHL